MVIVEGCDGGGKTTLVRHLSEKFGLPVGKRGVADRDFLWKVTRKDTYRAIAGAVSGQQPEIWDRLWISEYVYHGINPGRDCEFNPFETRWIKDVLNAIGCPVILCAPPFDVVESNAAKAHQMEGVSDSLRIIYAQYRDFSLPWPANTLRYDYTGQTPHFASLYDIEEEVAGYLEERRRRQP